MSENFPYLVEETDIYVQEAQKVPNNMKEDPQLRHLIIKVSKIKDK